MNEPISLRDFKDWLEKDMSDFLITRQDPDAKFIGKNAQPKVSEKKLMEKIKTKGDAAQLISEFTHEGGKVLSINGLSIKLETTSGEFDIPRFCVKIER